MNDHQLLLFVLFLGGTVVTIVIIGFVFFFRWRKKDLAMREMDKDRLRNR